MSKETQLFHVPCNDLKVRVPMVVNHFWVAVSIAGTTIDVAALNQTNAQSEFGSVGHQIETC